MKYIITSEMNKCGGCRECELVCSFSHTKSINPRLARIQVIKDEHEGMCLPITCFQCEEPFCMKVCPMGAIQQNPDTGAKVIDSQKCIGCRMCMIACPFGGIVYNPENNKVAKCDFCRGLDEPQCVKWCPKGVLNFVREDEVGNLKKRAVFRQLAKELTGGKVE